MDICVFVLVEISKRRNYRSRFLRGRSAIEINQRMPMRLFAKNREIFAKNAPNRWCC